MQINSISKYLIPLIALTVIGWFSWMNSDLIDGRFAIHMDEQITFDGVKKIYDAKDFREFKWAVKDGNDHRYGRILWNTLAVFSYIPYKVWGDSGLIYSNRIVLSSFLLGSYLLLIFLFIRSNYLRLLSLLLMISLPSTIYFFYLPKPEPIQLFLLIIGLYSFYRHRIRSFFFFGLAFGTKITTLPSLLYLLPVSFLTAGRQKKSAYIKQILALIFGWFLAVPILFKFKWKEYLLETFANTGHGQDDSSITVLSWLELLYSGYWSKEIFFTLFTLISMFVIFKYVRKKHEIIDNKVEWLRKIGEDHALLIMITSFSFLLPIMLFTKRVWGYYLHVGLVLLVVSLAMMIDKNDIKKKIVPLGLFVLLFVSSPISKQFKISKKISSRTTSPKFVKNKKRMDVIVEEVKSKLRLSRGVVYIDPNLFYPQFIGQVRLLPFWGAFDLWEKKPEMIIFDIEHLNKKYELTSSLHKKIEEFRAQLSNYLVDNTNYCSKSFCYKKLDKYISDELIILELVK